MVIHPDPLHYRSLQHLKHQALRGSQNYSSLIRMSQAAKEDLEMEREESSGHSARVGDRDRRLPDKVSAYCQGNLTGGRWSEEEQSLHINELELLVALRAFLKHVRDVSVLLKSDNVTTVAYINHLGGTRSRVLVNISKKLWLWCLQRGIALKAQHLPGKENLNTDFIPTGFSIQPDPEAEATDAFLQDWRNLQAYALPPWCFIARVLAKALCQKVVLVLVTPCWPTQPWFPQLMEMLADFP